MKLATKIIIGASIGIVAIFGIMVATVLITGFNTMSNFEDGLENDDRSFEIGNSDDVKPWSGMNCDEMLDFSGTGQHGMMQDSVHMQFHEHYMQQCS